MGYIYNLNIYIYSLNIYIYDLNIYICIYNFNVYIYIYNLNIYIYIYIYNLNIYINIYIYIYNLNIFIYIYIASTTSTTTTGGGGATTSADFSNCDVFCKDQADGNYGECCGPKGCYCYNGSGYDEPCGVVRVTALLRKHVWLIVTKVLAANRIVFI